MPTAIVYVVAEVADTLMSKLGSRFIVPYEYRFIRARAAASYFELSKWTPVLRQVAAQNHQIGKYIMYGECSYLCETWMNKCCFIN